MRFYIGCHSAMDNWVIGRASDPIMLLLVLGSITFLFYRKNFTFLNIFTKYLSYSDKNLIKFFFGVFGKWKCKSVLIILENPSKTIFYPIM